MTSELRNPTLATLQELREVPWFVNVGRRGKEVSTAVVLDNWYEAISSLEAGEWSQLRLDAVNGYLEQLGKISRDRARTWNKKVSAIKDITVPLIGSLFSGRADLKSLPKSVMDAVQWDVLHVCMEAEFSDCLPLGFFASNSYWYVSGHFPCGWQGRFPDGRLVIF